MAQTRTQKAQNARSQSSRSGGNLSKAYYKHAVRYGDYLDVRTYRDVKMTFNGLDTSKTRGKDGNRRDDSLSRSKIKLYRLVMANVGKHGKFRPIFATYTFKEPITELDTALVHYRKYIRRLQTFLGYKPKYVAVPQIQWERYEKEGLKVWHFHIVFFNVPKLDFAKNDKMWGQENNSVNLQFVRGVRSVGAYVAGYCTKKDVLEIPFNRQFYYSTLGLIQPHDIYEPTVIDTLVTNASVSVLSRYEGDNYSQIKYRLNG